MDRPDCAQWPGMCMLVALSDCSSWKAAQCILRDKTNSLRSCAQCINERNQPFFLNPFSFRLIGLTAALRKCEPPAVAQVYVFPSSFILPSPTPPSPRKKKEKKRKRGKHSLLSPKKINLFVNIYCSSFRLFKMSVCLTTPGQ